MLSEALRTALVAESALVYARVRRELRVLLLTAQEPWALLVEALDTLGRSDLPAHEQARRARVLVTAAPPLPVAEGNFVGRLAGLPVAIKTGIAGALPVEVLPLLYSRAPASTGGATGGGAPPGEALLEGKRPPVRGVAATVLLLSLAGNQQANVALLGSNGLEPCVVANLDDLDAFLSAPDVCGILIDNSVWAGRLADHQEALLRRVIRYSSFACLVVDTRGLGRPGMAPDLIAREHLREPSYKRLQLRASSVLSEEDLNCFHASAQLLAAGARPQFMPRDFTEALAVAVTAAAMTYFREERGRTGMTPDTVRFSRIGGGASSAQLLLIDFDDGSIPLICKVGAQDDIREEAERFEAYISPWDNHLRPRPHFHQGVGIIVFGLVEDATQPRRPAPTLAEKLDTTWRAETWDPSADLQDACAGIVSIVRRTCEKLATLNARPCTQGRFPSRAYLRGSGLRELSSRGVRWELAGVPALDVCIERAHAILAPLADAAIVHGDVHLRNVLARDTGDPYLIDYAFSGPGHPAYDLVRLECALLFQYLRPLGSEDDFAGLQHSISVGGAGEAALRASHEVWWSSALNSALLRGALLCRDRALDVLATFGAGRTEYIAAKFAVCCWSLSGLPQLQMGLIRGAIRALAPALNTH